jgi:3',5'-cyclic AMP phosphodiesterase CpdA
MRRLSVLVALAIAFATALAAFSPSPPARAPFVFIQLSDPQFGMYTNNADFAQETANFEFAIATVNRLRPAFVIITGDLVNKAGDQAQVAEYRRITAKLDPSIAIYNVAGNHDVENVPTPASLAAYAKIFGPDRYTFRASGFLGVVLNSSLIHSPAEAPTQLADQERWLRTELERARRDSVRHIVIFMHHPWFLASATEPDQYFNIPSTRRATYLALFREFGVRLLVSGHYHRNALARDGSIEMVTTGPVGRPMGTDKSGLRVFTVTDTSITHRYYELGELPNRLLVPR